MKISIQTGDIIKNFGIKKGYALIKECGFEAIDWNIDTAWDMKLVFDDHKLPEGNIFEKELPIILDHYKAELDEIKKNGLEFSQAHAPFPCYHIDIPGLLEYSIDNLVKCIELCNEVGCKYLIVHGASIDGNDTDTTTEEMDAMNKKLYEALIPTLQNCDVVVCLENLFSWKNGAIEGHCQNSKEAAEFIDYLNDKAGKEAFGFCLDVGHANLTKKDFRTVVQPLGSRLKTLHIHDNDGTNDKHLAPFTGTVNWELLLKCLKAVDYSGNLSFETCAQTNTAFAFDAEMVKPWLELIAQTGKIFRKKITE